MQVMTQLYSTGIIQKNIYGVDVLKKKGLKKLFQLFEVQKTAAVFLNVLISMF